jgi:two-component system cell cycle response regulator
MGAMADSRLDVLVVDDDGEARSALCKAVVDLGHACRGAEDGLRALELLQQKHADVIISDWEMPGMTGAELCRRTRKADDEDGPYTYFILLTAHADRQHMLDGMAAGADDYQTKPVDLDELEARLVSATRVVTLHRRLANRTEALRHDSRRFYVASRTDALTGVGNRLALHDELEQLYGRAARYGHRYCLAMADVDHFKRFNDTFGHLAGDEVLRSVTEAIRSEIRTSDALFRYGGEEFVIILPEQSLAIARTAIERVRRAIERLAIPGPDGPVTVSFGVAELAPEDHSPAEWLERADRALYAAKDAGRNRVEVSRTTTDAPPAFSAARTVKSG